MALRHLRLGYYVKWLIRRSRDSSKPNCTVGGEFTLSQGWQNAIDSFNILHLKCRDHTNYA